MDKILNSPDRQRSDYAAQPVEVFDWQILSKGGSAPTFVEQLFTLIM
jgi:hypothetical protein